MQSQMSWQQMQNAREIWKNTTTKTNEKQKVRKEVAEEEAEAEGESDRASNRKINSYPVHDYTPKL